jgi:hypothetical protein
MSFFYDLNKKLNSIGNEQEQIAKEVAKAANKSPVRKSLEESLRSDMKALMEDGTGGMNFSGSGSLEEGQMKQMMHKDAERMSLEKFVAKYGDEDWVREFYNNIMGPLDETAPKAFTSVRNKLAPYADKIADILDDGRLAVMDPNFLDNPNDIQQYTDVLLTMSNLFRKNPMKGLEYLGTLWSEIQEMSIGEVRDQLKIDLGQMYNQAFPNTGRSFEESALQAYIGDKKYGKQGMDALRKAGREHAGKDKMNSIRNKYNKMDESEMECDTPTPSKGIPGNVPLKDKMKRLNKGRDYYESDESEEDIMDYLNRKLAPHDKEQAKEDAISKPYNGSAGDADAYNGMEFEGNAFTGKLKSTPKGEKFSVGGKEYTDTSELDETMTRQHFQHTADLLKHIEDPAKRMELAKHHAGVFKASNPRFDHGKFMKACNCDEGVVGAALGGAAGALVGGPVGAVRGAMAGNAIGNAISPDEPAVDEGFEDMVKWLAQREKEKGTGKFDKRQVSTGTVYTRRFDDEPEDDTDAPASKGGNPAVKRGRGRPAGTKGATGARGPTGKSKLMAKDAMREEDISEVCDHCGQKIQEKAVSKKQQKFMGMVHAAQKGEKPASKEVAKVAKGMKKKDAEDFASTKHKGLPEKAKAKKTEEDKGDGNLANNAKPYDKVTRGDVVAGRLGKDEEGGKKKFKKEEKVEETTTSGSVANTSDAPKSSKGGMKFGGGIYDSWNRTIENMISENVNVNTTTSKNDDGQDHESITISVDGDDVSRFKELLQSMGIAQNHSHSDETHSTEPCGTCGGVPCQCDELAEADAPVSQNDPDYPTNQEESDDALQYSGGLNDSKSTGQTTVPVVASQEDRLHTMEESVDSFLNLYQTFKTK